MLLYKKAPEILVFFIEQPNRVFNLTKNGVNDNIKSIKD